MVIIILYVVFFTSIVARNHEKRECDALRFGSFENEKIEEKLRADFAEKIRRAYKRI